jgi:hypothetical protein
MDLVVDTNDVIAFGQAFPLGLRPADVNHDGVVNAQAAADFINDYTCGGGPRQPRVSAARCSCS